MPMSDTTRVVTLLSGAPSAADAAREIAEGIEAELGGAPDALVVFASARHDYTRLLEELRQRTGASVIAGASSAGEFTGSELREGHVSALALRSGRMRFAVGHGESLRADPDAAARQLAAGFEGDEHPDYPYRAALILTDALAGNNDTIVEALTVETGGTYRFFGGGAGDDGHFRQTHVFAGTRVMEDAVVGLEILSMTPIGLGVSHGWRPATEGFRVTEVEGARIVSLNGAPAVEAFEAHAARTGQTLDREDALPFFLHNVLGIADEEGHRLRVPLAIGEDGSIRCAAQVTPRSIVHVMATTEASAVEAARNACRAALKGLDGRSPAGALLFDCVATRLRLGRAFERELSASAEILHPTRFVGCNTYGQIARADGQFSGFHNCTAVVCVFPE